MPSFSIIPTPYELDLLQNGRTSYSILIHINVKVNENARSGGLVGDTNNSAEIMSSSLSWLSPNEMTICKQSDSRYVQTDCSDAHDSSKPPNTDSQIDRDLYAEVTVNPFSPSDSKWSYFK